MTAKPFATFNDIEHVNIDVPDKATTYSFRTSTGERLTVCFMSDKVSPRLPAPPNMVDIQYHDRGTVRMNNRTPVPTFDCVLMSNRFITDTRKMPGNEKPGLIYIPLFKDPEA